MRSADSVLAVCFGGGRQTDIRIFRNPEDRTSPALKNVSTTSLAVMRTDHVVAAKNLQDTRPCRSQTCFATYRWLRVDIDTYPPAFLRCDAGHTVIAGLMA